MIRWFQDCSKDDVLLVGGKCASLGEMIGAGKNVPPGFAVTINAYNQFMKKTGIDEQIRQIIKDIGRDKNGEIPFNDVTKKIRSIVYATPIPTEIKYRVRMAYAELSSRCGVGDALVAVRSSATMEDGADASYAGQHGSYLNICGFENVIEKIRECWVSLFSVQALHYRSSKNIDHGDALMAVAVQKMVNARSSGVAFTVDPVTGDRSEIVIESVWGLGEGLVSGYVTPDHYSVKRDSLEIIEKWVSPKTIEFVYDSVTGQNVERSVEDPRQNISSLSDVELIQLASMAVSIERHYGQPQDIEWAVDTDVAFPNNILILQSRAVTVWGGKKIING